MKCLAVQQPWAWAICAGFKRVENRTWETPYRGPIAIVASSKRTEVNRAVSEFKGGKLPTDTFSYSAIIGMATLANVVPLSEEMETEPHASGPFCWMLNKPKLFQNPISTKAKLRLYNSTPEEAELITTEAARPGKSVADPLFGAFATSLEGSPFSRVVAQAHQYFSTERWEELERVVPRILALDSNQPEGHYLQGLLALIDERHKDALAAFNRAIEIDPKCVQAYLGRSDAHSALGNKSAAKADQDRAIKLRPKIANEIED